MTGWSKPPLIPHATIGKLLLLAWAAVTVMVLVAGDIDLLWSLAVAALLGGAYLAARLLP